MKQRLATIITVLLAVSCLTGCGVQKAVNTQSIVTTASSAQQPPKATPGTPAPLPSPSAAPQKAAIETTLIDKVHWDKAYSNTSDEWHVNKIYSNGKHVICFGGTILCEGSSGSWADVEETIPGKSSLPEYFDYFSKNGLFELRYYPAEQKIRITDNEVKRSETNNLSGEYSLVIHQIAKYPKGAIIFTRMSDPRYQSVVMIPYVDGSADFIVNEKDTYHCDSYSKSDVPLYTRVYKCTKDGKEAMFSITVGNNSDPSSVTLFGNLLDQDLYGAYHADSTKY